MFPYLRPFAGPRFQAIFTRSPSTASGIAVNDLP